jgi:alcohol dehydrogenase YqhD (iron-dependent ADH family)
MLCVVIPVFLLFLVHKAHTSKLAMLCPTNKLGRMLHEKPKISGKVHKNPIEKQIASDLDWIWLGIEKNVNFRSNLSVDNELSVFSISSTDELCVSNERKKRETNVSLNKY